MKKKKVILFTNSNFEKEILEVLKDAESDFLIILYFGNDKIANFMLLEKVKKYFWKKEKNFYLKNMIIISTREYLANDLAVQGIIIPEDINSFDYFSLAEEYENFDGTVDKFIERNFLKYRYSFDLYNITNPWIYHKNGTNILKITNNLCGKILNNFHKIQNIIPDMLISFFSTKNNNETLIKIIKLVGADALVTLTFINNMEIAYTKRADAFIYIDSDDYEDLGTSFINELLDFCEKGKGVLELKSFFQIPDKNFDADLFYDEEEEIARKEIKYYVLTITQGSSLKTFVKVTDTELIFNYGLQRCYKLSKIEKPE